MFDHVGFAVSNYKKSKGFYLQALQPLGFGLMPLPLAQANAA